MYTINVQDLWPYVRHYTICSVHGDFTQLRIVTTEGDAVSGTAVLHEGRACRRNPEFTIIPPEYVDIPAVFVICPSLALCFVVPYSASVYSCLLQEYQEIRAEEAKELPLLERYVARHWSQLQPATAETVAKFIRIHAGSLCKVLSNPHEE